MHVERMMTEPAAEEGLPPVQTTACHGEMLLSR
jgi:hypothetical protein